MSPAPNPLIPPVNEIAHLDWSRVRSEAEERLDVLRKQNDDASLDPIQTAAKRGEIRALKWLLDLPQTVALKSQTPPPDYGGETF